MLGTAAALGAVGLAGWAVELATRTAPDPGDVPEFAEPDPGDEVSVTRAADVAIVTTDTAAGRRVTAFTMPWRHVLWQSQPGVLHTVRCAGDVRPPCAAVVEGSGDDEPAVAFVDPVTGTIGDTWWQQPAIEDIALSAVGDDLLVCDGKSPLVLAIELATKDGVDIRAPIARVRRVAFGDDGGYLIGDDKAMQKVTGPRPR